MRAVNRWMTGLTLVLGAWLMPAVVGFGDEKKVDDSAGKPAAGSIERAAQPDEDDHVRHHAALGVLMGQSADGVTVLGVLPGSAAALSGLRAGDEIRYVGDERIRTMQGLTSEIQKYSPGAAVDVTLIRGGERRIVRTALASREATFGNRHEVNKLATGVAAPADKRSPRPTDTASQTRRIRELQRQIAQLQQEVNRLMSYQSSEQVQEQEMQSEDWGWDGRDNQGHDPALFQ